jgi:hypothetical protein
LKLQSPAKSRATRKNQAGASENQQSSSKVWQSCGIAGCAPLRRDAWKLLNLLAILLVPRAGLEPGCGCPRWILSRRLGPDCCPFLSDTVHKSRFFLESGGKSWEDETLSKAAQSSQSTVKAVREIAIQRLAGKPAIFRFSGSEILELRRPCVYAWVRDDQILYIGKGSNGASRSIDRNHRIRNNEILASDNLKSRGAKTRGESNSGNGQLAFSLNLP